MRYRANLLGAAFTAVEFAFAMASGLSGRRAQFAPPPDADRTEGKGRLAVRNGRRFLHLEGSPREMGLQHGRLLRPILQPLMETYLRHVHVLRGLGRVRLLERGRRLEPFIPPDILEEMDGLAEGAGLSHDDVLIGHTFLEGMQAVACSCYAAFNSATRAGALVFGRNLEFLSMGVAHLAQMIVFCKPDRGIPFLSVSWPGWCGTLTAVNLQGLCVGPLNVNLLQSELQGEPYVVMFRRLAQEAATCREAVDLLRAAPRTYPNNVLLAQTWPHRHAVVAEYTRKHLAVRDPRAENDFILSTNHFRKLGRKEEWPEDRGYARYPALYRALRRAHGTLDVETDIFGDRRVHFPNSLHCLVAAPERREARLAFGLPAARAPYHRITYDANGIRLPPPRAAAPSRAAASRPPALVWPLPTPGASRVR